MRSADKVFEPCWQVLKPKPLADLGMSLARLKRSVRASARAQTSGSKADQVSWS